MSGSSERAGPSSRVLKEIGGMTASPPVAFQILNLIREPDYPSEALVHLVGLDPELTAQMLRWVNSAELRGSSVASVDEAIMRLGTAEIANTALALAVGRLAGTRRSSYCPDPKALWRHSVACALACRHLWVVCRGISADRDLVFTAGLLHDVGKIVINNGSKEDLEAITRTMKEEGIGATDAELEVLGADHGEVGGLLLESWNLPAALVAAVRFHHAPEFDPSGLATLIHVGDCCAKVQAGPQGWDDFQQALRPHALTRLGLSLSKVEECWGEILQNMEDVESLVGC